MRSLNSSCGFAYVATGKKFIEEAARSARSLRRCNPSARICLITDAPAGDKFWDDLVLLDKPHFGFLDKLEMRRAPYERTVFLDADTTVVGDLSELFVVLERYDVCGVQWAEGQDYVMEGGIPHAFPEMNGGVIGFRKCAVTMEFFQLWERFYKEFHALNRDGHYHYANVGDQKSLRAALWHSSVRHACIGGEFNFIPFKVEFASLPVAVLHTRTNRDLSVLAKRLNARLGRRCYVPSLDAVVMDHMRGAELRRVFLGAIRLGAMQLAKGLAPSRLRRWFGSRLVKSKWLHGNRYSPAEGGPKNQKQWERPWE